MDVNATVRDLRFLLAANKYGAVMSADDSDRVRDLWEALDNWLSQGGALPDDWADIDPAQDDRGHRYMPMMGLAD